MSLHLTRAQRTRLVDLLTAIPECNDQEGRWAMLLNALAGTGRGERLLTLIDKSGPCLTFTTRALNRCAEFGEIQDGEEALGALLAIAKDYMSDSAMRETDELLGELGLAPGSAPALPRGWRGPMDIAAAVTRIEERELVADAFLEQRFLRLGVRAGAAVVRIRTAESYGTGFMVTPELLLTAAHVVKTPELASAAEYRFFFEETDRGGLSVGVRAGAADPALAYLDAKLDFALVRLADAPYGRSGDVGDDPCFEHPLRISMQPLYQDDIVPVIQHPGGEPKKVALRRFVVAAADENEVQYYTSTRKGSSGAPVFDREFRAVAVHQTSCGFRDEKTGKVYSRNLGRTLGSVMRALRRDAPDLLREIEEAQATF